LAIPAAPASADDGLVTITNFGCESMDSRFFCEVDGWVNAGYGTRTEWWVNNFKIETCTDLVSFERSCVLNAQVSVRTGVPQRCSLAAIRLLATTSR
jgi:hypothetical protein